MNGYKKALMVLSGIAVLLAVALGLTFIIGKPFTTLGEDVTDVARTSDAGKSFDTPEEAIEYFVKAVAGNNLSNALKASAVEDYTEGFDFTKWCKRLQALLPRDLAPSEYPMYQQINRELITSRIASQIKILSYSLLSDINLAETMVIKNDDEISSFIEEVDPGKLKDLKLVRIDTPVPDIMNSERNIKNFKAQAEVYGADEATERVVLYELDGQSYYGGYYLIHYKKGWKIASIHSSLAGLSVDGSAVKTTKQEYLDSIE